MKAVFKCGHRIFMLAALLLCFSVTVKAAPGTIRDGVYAGEMKLSGLTEEQADSMIRNYVEELGRDTVVLVAAGGREVEVSASELGIRWNNPEIVQEAALLGTQGNVIQRYKALKDLLHENKVYDIELVYDVAAINDILVNRCSIYDQKAVDADLVREDGRFVVIEGQTGYQLDVEASIDAVYDFMDEQWNGNGGRISLCIATQQPRGSAEELAQITDILGTCTTDFSSSNSNRTGNVNNGCSKINGTLLYPGDEFSATETVSPFTVANGYALAGAYSNGKVVESIGGGICQVSTTLYNAVLQAELQVTMRYPHSMIVSYVSPSADAAIAESAGKDFRFINNTDYPIYIEGYTKNKKITFNIYGKETRSSDRQVRYESEILEVINPTVDNITADPGKALGYISTESAHTGYKARLWKIVKENGKEVSREIVNSSNYNVSPRHAVVGVATDDPQKYEEIMAAIGTYSIDHVRTVIGLLTQPAAE